MSYDAIIAGLVDAIETVAGINLVLGYVPRGIQTTPMVYSEHIGTTYEDASDNVAEYYRAIHRTKHRLVLSWVENEQCESELRAYKEAIAEAIKADPKLSGTLDDGWARITNDESGWLPNEQGVIVYRICDIYSEVWELEV